MTVWGLSERFTRLLHIEWTVSQILAHLEVPTLIDDQLRKCAETCVGKYSCGDVACTAEGCIYAPHSEDYREDSVCV